MTRLAPALTYFKATDERTRFRGFALCGPIAEPVDQPGRLCTPPNNIGRFGDSQVGSVLGPGENVVSLSLFKHVALTERIRMEIGGAAANLFNHPNYAVPGT